MIKTIKNIKLLITELLTKYPHLRDDDNKLMANIWNSQSGNTLRLANTKFMTAFEFLRAFSEHKYISPEAICRCRRKVQEQNPALRGKLYIQRKAKCNKVIKEISNL